MEERRCSCKSRLIYAIIAVAVVVGALLLFWKPKSGDIPDIVVQNMVMEMPVGESIFVEELMPNEVIDTKIYHKAFVGPITQRVELEEGYTNMFITIKGDGVMVADGKSYDLVPESIAIPITMDSVEIEVEDGETLHFVQFTKVITEEDVEDWAKYPEENLYDLFYTRFIDCEPYVEPIKSPNTVSRTVLPGDILPRIALGTVGSPKGPDKVGEHSHPMLDQLFLGLADNDIVVHADGASAPLGEFALLHIPLGSFHSVTVDRDKTMYYLWMDFFMDREGQEWLKTHKPITRDE